MKKVSFFTIIFTLFISTNIIYAQETVDIVIPSVPKVPSVIKPISKDSTGKVITTLPLDEILKEEKVQFSTNVAPRKFRMNFKPEVKQGLPGEVSNGQVSAYLHLPLMDKDTVINQLKEAGFEVLATFKVDKKGIATSIIFTNKEIQEAASFSNRGFAASLRVLLDKKNKVTSITNPIYLLKGFMQKEYKEQVAVNALEKIRSVFPDIQNSPEMIKERVLENYRFMENMPYYQDMKVIAEGDNQMLFETLKKTGKIVYEQHLSNGSIVAGVKMGRRTSKFVKRIGYTNSGLLPYPVLIENSQAKILAPQFYIAFMYPLLKMSKFMKIATTPGSIEKEIDVLFR